MIDKEHFFELVTPQFEYLIAEYNFGNPVLRTTQRMYHVEYTKGELMIRISYSLANIFLEVKIYNHISKVEPGSYSWKYSVDLSHLMKRANTSFDYADYLDLMPSKIPMGESIGRLAELLKLYGSSILQNQEWVSWGELTGYTQYVPPHLP